MDSVLIVSGACMLGEPEHFGQVLRRIRMDRGLSLRCLADLAQMSKSKIQLLESRAGSQVSEVDAAHLDEVLECGIALAAAAQRDRVAALPRLTQAMVKGANSYTNLAIALLAGATEQQGADAVQRRTFLQAGLGVPALALEATRQGMGAAMSARVDAATDEWEEIVYEHGFAYMTTSPRDMLEPLMVDLIAIQYAATDTENESNARDLIRFGALLAALSAMTLANLGQLRESHRWWRTSRQLAQQSGDSRTQAWVHGREIVRALYEKRPIGSILSMVERFDGATARAPKDSLLEFMCGKAQALALAGRAQEAMACLT